MKKLLLFVVFVGLTYAQAQVTYGLKVGTTLGEMSNMLHEQRTHPSFFFSAFADLPVAKNFSIQTGLSIQGKGSDYKEVFGNGKLDHILSVTTIEIPVNAVYSIQTGRTGKFLAGVGPYIGFNVSGVDNYTGNYGDVNINVSDQLNVNNENKDLNLIDAGANFMVGYRFTNKLLLSVNYNLGLTDILPDMSGTQSFRGWALGIGFHF